MVPSAMRGQYAKRLLTAHQSAGIDHGHDAAIADHRHPKPHIADGDPGPPLLLEGLPAIDDHVWPKSHRIQPFALGIDPLIELTK